MKLLEASGRIGGRVKDDFSLGPCVGLGAMFITGVNNNPLTLLASQLGLGLHYTNEDRCELISEDGWRPDPATDKRVETHFNQALDKLADWRKDFSQQDVALGGEFIRDMDVGVVYGDSDFIGTSFNFWCVLSLYKQCSSQVLLAYWVDIPSFFKAMDLEFADVLKIHQT